MMTFNLNRPVYSFGLGLVFVLQVILPGGITCKIPVKDTRDFFIEHQADIAASDMRILAVSDGRERDIGELREFRVSDNRVQLVTDTRIFIVEDDRVYFVERNCDDNQD